jgi:hypothetical protein
MFKWKFLVFILGIALLCETVWIYGRSDSSRPEAEHQDEQYQHQQPQMGPPAPNKVDPQMKALQEEVHQIEDNQKKWGWPKLEDVGVWAGIASLIATVLIAAGGILLGHAYIADITEKILSADNLLMTGRIHASLAMLALCLQWNEKKGYSRNTTVDLEELIFDKSAKALEAFDDFDALNKGDGEKQSRRYRLACMNNLLLGYALADDAVKYGSKAVALLSDWQKEIPTKQRRAVMYRLTELRVQVTYPEDVYDLGDKAKYREQLHKLEKEIMKLSKDKSADHAEVESLSKRLEAALTRFA